MSKILEIGITKINNATIENTETIELVEGKGIEGDRYFKDFNDIRSQITLIESENIDFFNSTASQSKEVCRNKKMQFLYRFIRPNVSKKKTQRHENKDSCYRSSFWLLNGHFGGPRGAEKSIFTMCLSRFYNKPQTGETAEKVSYRRFPRKPGKQRYAGFSAK